MPDPRSEREPPEGIDAATGLARVAGGMAWNAGRWAAGAYVKGARRVVRAATSPREAARLAREVEENLLTLSSTLMQAAERATSTEGGWGPEEGELAPAATAPAATAPDAAPVRRTAPSPPRAASTSANGHGPTTGEGGGSLQARGEELIRRSRDVNFDADVHPAYERILSELAPDEGRVLLLLATKGPQPTVDVRTGGPLGLLTSKLIAPGLSMIGSRAGVRHPERVPAYLNNLFRLGLVWFSRETLPDQTRYQVLEAQPDVIAALHTVRQARTVRRSIHLTPFGEDFCRSCLPVDAHTLARAPHHATPPAPTKAVGTPPALGPGGG